MQDEFPAAVAGIAFMFGSIIGSFLNVVVYRLPLMIEEDWKQQANEILGNKVQPIDRVFNLVWPNSHCPSCQNDIKPWENIPILSYIFLKGKCAHCDASISWRYPAVELLTGILTVAIIMVFGPTPVCLWACVLTWALIALSLIDYDTQLLPDDITLPLMWLGLVVNYFGLITNLQDAFIGACLGYLSLWSVFHIFKLVTGKDGMGYGDFKLLAMLGAWLGWQLIPLIIILSSLAGTVIGGILIGFGRDKAKPLSFGPCLAVAGWIALIWGEQITRSYLQFTGL
ncbi:MAG: prepilin peptidase [Gammaproteobacteria bacterium]|jgi:leader peptidase (prepilin peptidase)/N-methyltransferase|nr:prepilin peptidase [Gammaproteobacteria bacterium]|tara:strand:- start:199 stop:1050 length:852 start_codon:yes stop_codon:yes gene_type:complete